jgi:hypothetical protein
MLRRNVELPFSRPRNKPNKVSCSLHVPEISPVYYVLDAGVVLGLFSDPEDGGHMLFRNVNCHFVLGSAVLKSRLGNSLL